MRIHRICNINSHLLICIAKNPLPTRSCDLWRGGRVRVDVKKPTLGRLTCQESLAGIRILSYFTCLPIRPAISNIETWGLPKTSLSLASALIMRLLAASCSLLALM